MSGTVTSLGAIGGTAHSASEWFQVIGIGAVIGALGQGARTIVGLKKLSDVATTTTSLADLIVVSRMVVSFLIGAVAGALAAFTIIGALVRITAEQIFAIAAAGYAGSDFIEGFISRAVPSTDAPAGAEAVGTGGGEGAPAPDASGAVG